MACDLQNGPFFSSLFIPALPFRPTCFAFDRRPFPSSSSTRWLHACTYACSIFFVLRHRSPPSLSRPLSFRSFFPRAPRFFPAVPLPLLLLRRRRRTFVRVPVHSFVESPLASSDHVTHESRWPRWWWWLWWWLPWWWWRTTPESFLHPLYPSLRHLPDSSLFFPPTAPSCPGDRCEERRGITASAKSRLMKSQFNHFTIHRFHGEAGPVQAVARGGEEEEARGEKRVRDWSRGRFIWPVPTFLYRHTRRRRDAAGRGGTKQREGSRGKLNTAPSE